MDTQRFDLQRKASTISRIPSSVDIKASKFPFREPEFYPGNEVHFLATPVPVVSALDAPRQGSGAKRRPSLAPLNTNFSRPSSPSSHPFSLASPPISHVRSPSFDRTPRKDDFAGQFAPLSLQETLLPPSLNSSAIPLYESTRATADSAVSDSTTSSTSTSPESEYSGLSSFLDFDEDSPSPTQSAHISTYYGSEYTTTRTILRPIPIAQKFAGNGGNGGGIWNTFTRVINPLSRSSSPIPSRPSSPILRATNPMPFTLPSEPTPFSFFTDNDPKPFTFPMHPTPFSRPTSPISTPLPPSRSQSPIQQALNFVTRHLAFELDLDERIQGEREQEDVGRLEIYVTREVLVVSEVDERRGMGRRGW